MQETFRTRLAKLRQNAEDILKAPRLSLDLKSFEVSPHTAYILTLKTLVSPTPKFTTLSDSKLYVYQGLTLGIRQLFLAHAYGREEAIPPGFSEAPPRLLAVMALNFTKIEGIPFDPYWSEEPLSQEALELVDAWEDSGLGPWATPAFRLSHCYFPESRRWVPFTPDMEGVER